MEAAKRSIRCALSNGFVGSYLAFPLLAYFYRVRWQSRFSPQRARLLTRACVRKSYALPPVTLQIQSLAWQVIWNGRCFDYWQRVRARG
jgi:hypothetical protein